MAKVVDYRTQKRNPRKNLYLCELCGQVGKREMSVSADGKVLIEWIHQETYHGHGFAVVRSHICQRIAEKAGHTAPRGPVKEGK